MRSGSSSPQQTSGPSALGPADLTLTHLDWNPETTLVHFQGKQPAVSELDYAVLQCEIQRVPKAKAAVDIGDLCLVEDSASSQWYRGRVQNRKEDLFDVFLIDYGNILSVGAANVSACSDNFFSLLPRMVCGFLSNVLISQKCRVSTVEQYFSTLIGKTFTGHTRALLPHKVLVLEIPEINSELGQHGFGRHVDTDTFLFLVEVLTEIPVKRRLFNNPRGKDSFFKRPALRAYEDLSCHGPRLPSGTRATVRVTAAASARLFYCQMCSADADLSDISQKLAAVFEGRTKETERQFQDNLGLLCAVKGKDWRWHRGFLPFLPDKSQIRVFFIDCGFFESVNVQDVHRLPHGLSSTPFMAFACSLSLADEVVDARQLSFLKSGLLGSVLEVEVRDFDEKEHLHAIRITDAEEKDVKEAEPIPKTKMDSAAEDLVSHNSYLYVETVLQETFVRTLGMEEMKTGAPFVGFVVYAQNPDRFWMRTQKRNPDFEEMMSEMGDHFREVKTEEEVLVNPKLGTLCCAMYEQDLLFYRALVVGQLLHGYEVLFIDFGNIEKVPHKLVKKIPRAFADVPPFAFCCSLVNVLPSDDVWTTAICEVFRRTVSEKVLRVHVVQLKKSTFVVDLYEVGREGTQSISELVAAWRPDGSLSGATPKPAEEKLPKHQRRAEIADADQRTRREGKTPQAKTAMAQNPVCFRALNIKPGCQLAVSCSCATSPSDFWCLPFENNVAEMMAEIQLHYSAHTVPLRAGDSCCVVRSPQDGRWYRAVIADRQPDLCTLLLVDYGYSVRTHEHDLQGILPHFLHLEAQAFWCSLSRLLVPVDPVAFGGWNPVVCSSLKRLLHANCSLRCVVVSQWSIKNKGLCNVVELYSSKVQPSVTRYLVERNLAREVAFSAQQMSTEFPKSFVYSSFGLRPGGTEEVFVTHIVSQAEIYCHLERNIDAIEKLEMKISEETQKRTQVDSKAVVKNLCLAKYFDGQWYRGLVRPVQSPLHVGVFFVDYGNSAIAEKTHLMGLPAESSDLLFSPMQALRFRLASVPREELYADIGQWLSDTLLNKQARARVVAQTADGSFEVELFDGDVNVNQKVTELIKGLLPKPKPVLSFSAAKEGKPAAKKRSDRRASTSRWSDKRRVGGVCERPFNKYISKNSRKAPVKDKKEEPVHPQRNPEEEQAAPHTSGASVQEPRDEQTGVPQLSRLPDAQVSEGLRALCFVSHIDSLSTFFLQQAEDEPAILKMAEDLNSDGFRDSLERVSPTSLQTGRLVLAEYERDGALYRSVVTHRQGNCVKVQFVDYGNSSVMEDKLFSIPEEFLSQARFSIPCSLSDNHTYESDASFANAVMEKPLLVQFLHQPGPQWKVVIVEGAADLPEPPEAADGEGRENAPENSPGPDDRHSSGATETVGEVEAVETGEALPAADGKEATPAPPVSLSSKVKRGTCCCRRRRPDRLKSLPKDVRSKEKPVAPLNIKPEDRENCTLLSVLSDGSFYVRLQRTAHLLSALGHSIADARHRCELLPVEEVKRGLKCLVQPPHDQLWHRAVVQHVFLQTCQVLLDDHGRLEEIPVGSIRQRCERLAEVPKLAVLCQANASGLGDQLWWQESLQLLVGSEVRLVFVCPLEVCELWEVEMIVSRSFLARPSPQRPDELVTSQPLRLSFAPVEVDRAYRGFAAAVTNPFEFYVLLEDSLTILKTVSTVLADLAKQQLLPLPGAHLLPGTCCLFKSRTKKKWCRAEIVHSASTIILNLLDYGLYEGMAHENAAQLRMLPLEMRSLPKVIRPCILQGVKPVGADSEWSDEAASFFQRCLFHKNLQIVFRARETDIKWKVDMLADGIHVAKQLVQAQQAQYVDAVRELSFQEWRPGEGDQSEEERNKVCDGFLSCPDEVKEKLPFLTSTQCSLM